MIGRNAHILLVEDNRADVELMRAALEDAGFSGELHVVSNGEEALAFLRREREHRAAPRPSVVLLDLNLPRLGGLGVLAELRKDDDLATIAVIVMSSSDAPRDVLESYANHANCYLCKPADLDEFFEVIGATVKFWFEVAKIPG